MKRKKLSGPLSEEVGHRIQQAARRLPPNASAREIEDAFKEHFSTEYSEWCTTTRSELARHQAIRRVVSPSQLGVRTAGPANVGASRSRLPEGIESEKRRAFLREEVFIPLSREIREACCARGGSFDDLPVRFSMSSLKRHPLFVGSVAYLETRPRCSSLGKKVDAVEATVSSWNTEVLNARAEIESAVREKLAEVAPIAESYELRYWKPGAICLPYVLSNLWGWWNTLALRDDRPSFLVRCDWPSFRDSERWLEEGGFNTEDVGRVFGPKFVWYPPMVNFGHTGLVELSRSENAGATKEKLRVALASLVSDPQVLNRLADLKTRRLKVLEPIEELISVADDIDRVSDEIRLGVYDST